MSFPFIVLRATRQKVLQLTESLSLAQMNQIPAGFGNNLIWNAGHLIATQQVLCYALASLPTPIEADFIARYRKGSRPDGTVSMAEWTFIKDRLVTSVDQFEDDLRQLDFSNFSEYSTSYGVSLSNIGQALSFNNSHEALHLGTMMAMKKLIVEI